MQSPHTCAATCVLARVLLNSASWTVIVNHMAAAAAAVSRSRLKILCLHGHGQVRSARACPLANYACTQNSATLACSYCTGASLTSSRGWAGMGSEGLGLGKHVESPRHDLALTGHSFTSLSICISRCALACTHALTRQPHTSARAPTIDAPTYPRMPTRVHTMWILRDVLGRTPRHSGRRRVGFGRR